MIDSFLAARRLAAARIGACAARVAAMPSPRALELDDALAEARRGFAAQVAPAHHAAWERVLQMLRSEPPPGAWAVVLTELAPFEDGLALMSLFETGTVYANDSPDDDIGHPFGISNGGYAELIAVQLASNGDDAPWRMEDFHPSTRASEASEADLASWLARCREAGVELRVARR